MSEVVEGMVFGVVVRLVLDRLVSQSIKPRIGRTDKSLLLLGICFLAEVIKGIVLGGDRGLFARYLLF